MENNVKNGMIYIKPNSPTYPKPGKSTNWTKNIQFWLEIIKIDITDDERKHLRSKYVALYFVSFLFAYFVD